MRPIDADGIVFDYSGLAHIPPYDGAAIAKYFADQVKAMPTITPPPNDPLTLKELLEMDGEPVWVIFNATCEETAGMWALVSVDEYTREVFLTNRFGGRSTYEEAVVDIKTIYRRKPEEGA